MSATPRAARAASVALLLTLTAGATQAQQVVDWKYKPVLERPAFAAGVGPRVGIDEAHYNFDTMGGLYGPFARLLEADGYRVAPDTARFSPGSLTRWDVLVIANPLGDPRITEYVARRNPFAEEERAALVEWVRAGGSLFLIAEHGPMGEACQELASAFGVRMSGGYVRDTLRLETAGLEMLFFTPERGLDTTHAIMRGRDSTERVRKVVAFTGQALQGPADATVLLALSPAATDFKYKTGSGLRPTAGDRIDHEEMPVGGWAQGLAFPFGKGRVVVLGEAAMATVQLVRMHRRAPIQRIGLEHPGTDNRQFVLNCMRWLSRTLD